MLRFSPFVRASVALVLAIGLLINPATGFNPLALMEAARANVTAWISGTQFTDIADSPFHDDIVWLASAGITSGCADDRFCPDGTVTREQMASFLSRALGLPPTDRDHFRDDEQSEHEGEINRLASAGITGGCDERRFCPTAKVTREQMASFLTRGLELKSATRDYFRDDESSDHEPSINRFAEARLTGGCADVRYCPSESVTRGQMAAFLRRALDSAARLSTQPQPQPTAQPQPSATTATPAPATPAPSSSQTTSPTPTPKQTPTSTQTPKPTTTPAPTPTPTAAPLAPVSASAGILTTTAELAALPTSGAAWNALKSTADGDWGPANISDMNNRHGVRTLSGALVYARTGDVAYRTKVVRAIESAMAAGWYVSDGTELGISRNLGAYVMAADLVGYRTTAFEGWARTLMTAKVDTHPTWNVVKEVSEISANNHGTFALATRTAVAIYLGDRADLDRAWAIFRGYSDGSWARFKPTADYDPAWQCGSAYVPINPSCSKDGRNLDGAPVDDAARSDYPTPDGGYINEAMQGYAVMGILFHRQGYPAWSTGNNAILRVAQFQQRFGIWNYHSTGHYVGPVINHFYGAGLPTEPAVPGRLLGYTDWLYGN